MWCSVKALCTESPVAKEDLRGQRGHSTFSKQKIYTVFGVLIFSYCISSCMNLYVDPQASSGAGGELGDSGGSHACGVPGARPKRPQPALRLQHQDPPRESQ